MCLLAQGFRPRHWVHGGDTKLENLDGTNVAAAPEVPRVIRGLPRTEVERVLTGTGERMDLGHGVDAVIAALTRPGRGAEPAAAQA